MLLSVTIRVIFCLIDEKGWEERENKKEQRVIKVDCS